MFLRNHKHNQIMHNYSAYYLWVLGTLPQAHQPPRVHATRTRVRGHHTVIIGVQSHVYAE